MKTYWSKSEAECLAAVWQAYRDEREKPQTVRHYYYKLLSAGVVGLLDNNVSAKNAYGYVSRLIAKARNQGGFPWEAVIDPGRRSNLYPADQSLAEFIELQLAAYFRADIWRGQPCNVELWVEKDGLFEMAEEILKPYRVTVHVAKGNPSVTVLEKMAQRIRGCRHYAVLYAGDFDPSGLDIERAMRDELRSQHKVWPHFERIGLTYEDTLALPSYAGLDTKKDDKRAPRFKKYYGESQKCFEIEALSRTEFEQRLLFAVHSYLDLGALREAKEVESIVERETEDVLRGALDTLPERIQNALPPDRAESMIRYLNPPPKIA